MHPSQKTHTKSTRISGDMFQWQIILVCLRYRTESDFKKKTFMRYMVGLDLKMPKFPKFPGQRWWVFCSSRKWLDLWVNKLLDFRFYFSMRRFQEFQQKKNTIIWPKLSKIFIQVKLDGWLPVPHGLLTNITKFRSTVDDKPGQVEAQLPWDTELPNMRQWEQRIIPV